MKMIAVASFALLTLSACATTSGRPIDDSKVATFKKDITTRSDVIAALGEPASMTRDLSGNTVLAYGESTMKQDPKAYIPLVGILFVKPSLSSHGCGFTFNAHDLLIGESCTTTQN